MEVVTDTVDELGLPVVAVVQEPTRIPFYKPDIYPVILQKNVSVYGKFLGDSDIDKISDQQNTTNRIEAKIIDKLTKSGSYISLPNDAKIRYDEEDMKKIYLSSPADKSYLDVYDLQGDIEQDMAYTRVIDFPFFINSAISGFSNRRFDCKNFIHINPQNLTNSRLVHVGLLRIWHPAASVLFPVLASLVLIPGAAGASVGAVAAHTFYGVGFLMFCRLRHIILHHLVPHQAGGVVGIFF